MRGICKIMVFAAAAIIPSCSIKEDRKECPCFLDVSVLRQAVEIFPSNRAWCSVWANGTENVGEHVFEPVIGSDGLYSCSVKKNPSTAVVISNIEPNNGKIATQTGCQMERLYVSRHDIDCTGEQTLALFDSFGKQYVTVRFRLDKEAQEFKDNLTLTFDGPYDGLSLPSLTAHKGTFSYLTEFDEKGEAAVRIPPQGGPGLKIGIRLDNNQPATVDLYRLMLDAGFDWKSESLRDFTTKVSLNSITGILEFVDWDVVNLDVKMF